jgi:hypothetical protein
LSRISPPLWVIIQLFFLPSSAFHSFPKSFHFRLVCNPAERLLK